MRIETHGQQLEVTPALREYVDNKLQRIDRHFDQPIEIRVQLGLRKPDHHAEATLTVPGRTLHADATGENMYAAIDVLADKLDRLILKHKEKQQDHHARQQGETSYGRKMCHTILHRSFSNCALQRGVGRGACARTSLLYPSMAKGRNAESLPAFLQMNS